MVHLLIAASTISLVLSASALAQSVVGPIADLQIVNAAVSPDGFSRQAVLADGQFPGPLIAAIKGSEFFLNVHNQLNNHTMLETTSIHWHGLFQKSTNWADGVSFVNQCPISPNTNFLYQFNAGNQAGTFWYHSHLGLQYCDGLRGALVIYDPFDPLQYLYDIDDASTVITLADWYHIASNLAPVPAYSDSTLINGKGRYAGGPLTDLAVMNVVWGLRYRFRLVSMSCEPNYLFSIDGHSMMIIEADGVEHQPLTVDSLTIFAGQRYSFVLIANQRVDNYWIRSQPNFSANTSFVGGLNSAILRYVGAKPVEPTTSQTPSSRPLIESSLQPLSNPAAPANASGDADVKLNLELGFDPSALHFTVNGAAFIPPSVPVLLQILSGAKTAQELMPAGSLYTLPRNKVIEVTISPGAAAAAGGPHPFHLHGHTFSVVRGVNQTVPNYHNPPRRDVVSTGTASDNVTIRFTTDNPGPWIFHCHIDSHLNLGLAVVFAEDPADTPYTDPVPTEWNELCPEYNALQESQQ